MYIYFNIHINCFYPLAYFSRNFVSLLIQPITSNITLHHLLHLLFLCWTCAMNSAKSLNFLTSQQSQTLYQISNKQIPSQGCMRMKNSVTSHAPCCLISRFNFFGTASHLVKSIISQTFWWALTFTSPRQAVQMPKPISLWLPSILSDPVWTTATDSLHVSTASGAWLYLDSSLAQLEFSSSWLQAFEWWRLAEHRRPARILTQAADAESDTGSLTPLAQVPARPSGASRAGASHSSHPPTCRQDTALLWDLTAGFFGKLLLAIPSPTVR